MEGPMPYSRSLTAATLLVLAGCGLVVLAGCGLAIKPQGQGPQWVERPIADLTDALGKPDRIVRLPLPSLSTVFLYTAGAAPGYAICEREYFIRGGTVVGYSEHGSDPNCIRSKGNTQ
jgi:hypothetical protein